MKIILVSSHINYFEKTKNMFFSLVNKEKILKEFDISFIIGGASDTNNKDYDIFKFVKYNSFELTSLYYAIDNNIENFLLLHDTSIITFSFLEKIKNLYAPAKLAKNVWSGSMGNYDKDSINCFKTTAYDECYNTSNDSFNLKNIKELAMKYEDFFTFRHSDNHCFSQESIKNMNKRNCVFLGDNYQEINSDTFNKETLNKLNDVNLSNRIIEKFDCGIYKLKANYAGITKKYIYEV